jgi:hypothetical protein
MTDESRTERTQGLKERLSASDRAALLQVRFAPGYEVLLDVMEMACIAQESNLINCEPEDKDKIYAEFLLAKAFWQVFTAVQKKVNEEVAIARGIEQDEAYETKRRAEHDPQQDILSPFLTQDSFNERPAPYQDD